MFKRFYLSALISVFAIMGLAITDSNAGYVCGDANGDGALNVSDAVFIINHVFIGGPAPDPYCCDVCPPTVTDYDGNVYQNILIGDQCWMMENLKVIHFRNGDPISHVTDGGIWSGLSTEAYCEYDNDPANVDIFGRMYNWYAVDDSRNIAPVGWHVPSDTEWKQLEMYLGMSQAEADGEGWRGTDEGGKLKEAGTTHWNPPNEGATNESGFTALPGGYRHEQSHFYAIGEQANFWLSTEFSGYSAWTRGLGFNVSYIARSGGSKRYGFSVRCIKD